MYTGARTLNRARILRLCVNIFYLESLISLFLDILASPPGLVLFEITVELGTSMAREQESARREDGSLKLDAGGVERSDSEPSPDSISFAVGRLLRVKNSSRQENPMIPASQTAINTSIP